jgi:hypothetical protein
MKVWVFVILGLMGASTLSAAEVKEGYYLEWDSDHTERMIIPEYPIESSDISNHKVYKIKYNQQSKPVSIQYYQYGVKSNGSNFGGHMLKVLYSENYVERSFYNIDGVQIKNNVDVFTEKFPLDEKGFYTKKLNLNEHEERMADRFGVAEYQFIKRDEQSRRTRVRHVDVKGNVVKDRFNEFWETELAFDEKNHVKYRKGFDLNNVPMENDEGYATANFWINSKGDIVAEEFRNLEGERVVVNSGFARIEFSRDGFGRITKVRYLDENAAFVSPQAAIARLSYDDYGRRTTIEYFDKHQKPANHSSGVARYVYFYKTDKGFDKRVGYNVAGKVVN